MSEDAIVTASGEAPEPSFKRSAVDHVFRSAAEIERQNQVLTNLLTAAVLKGGGSLELTADEVTALIEGQKIGVVQDPKTKGVTITVTPATEEEKRKPLWLPPKVGE